MANQSEQRQRLLEAQNANRGHPRKGEVRPKRKQINISCDEELRQRFSTLSLHTGKTKRTLLEEALRELFLHYQDGCLDGFE